MARACDEVATSSAAATIRMHKLITTNGRHINRRTPMYRNQVFRLRQKQSHTAVERSPLSMIVPTNVKSYNGCLSLDKRLSLFSLKSSTPGSARFRSVKGTDLLGRRNSQTARYQSFPLRYFSMGARIFRAGCEQTANLSRATEQNLERAVSLRARVFRKRKLPRLRSHQCVARRRALQTQPRGRARSSRNAEARPDGPCAPYEH